jgi:hypothetical protein
VTHERSKHLGRLVAAVAGVVVAPVLAGVLTGCGSGTGSGSSSGAGHSAVGTAGVSAMDRGFTGYTVHGKTTKDFACSIDNRAKPGNNQVAKAHLEITGYFHETCDFVDVQQNPNQVCDDSGPADNQWLVPSADSEDTGAVYYAIWVQPFTGPGDYDKAQMTDEAPSGDRSAGTAPTLALKTDYGPVELTPTANATWSAHVNSDHTGTFTFAGFEDQPDYFFDPDGHHTISGKLTWTCAPQP